ncbi:DEAD/DEAH box helicase [Alphaproteobacteria bacterium]|nr:DEAD/DEAH box helicase [Alphaproteobacteria bacterium]
MNFDELGLSKEILSTINEIGYKEPTEIQKKAIPQILMGRDVLGCAQTGTGKTGSFIIPLVEILSSGKSKSRMPRCLILAPTRELAMQVSEEFNVINKYFKLQMALLIGGVSFAEQDIKLTKGVDVLVATPGRLLDHIERGKVIIKEVKLLIIDEADRMLDMGFIPDIIKINKLLPRIRQTLFFSATLSKEILDIGKDLLINPKEIAVSPSSSTSQNIESLFVKFDNKNKLNNLINLIGLETIRSAVVFCNKKKDIEKVNLSLKKNNYQTVCLHGDMDQSSRISSLDQFKKGTAQILIASDVAARGIDVDNISHVFNYDVPNNPEDYVHRIGRTGRAGKKGKAFTIYEEYDEKNILMIEKVISQKIKTIEFEKISLNSNLKDKKNDTQNNTEIHNTTKKVKPKFLPIENFLNFKDSGKIPNFLASKN